jgi:D-glutamate N-acetyltransferase
MVDLVLPQPYLLFLGDTTSAPHAKTAFGLRDWAPERCVGEYALPASTVTTGLPRLTPAQASAQGARSLVIGVAPSGGVISAVWVPALVEALEAGLDLVSGMHTRLEDVPQLSTAAARLGRRLINVREPPAGLTVGTGRKRTGKRLLTVGTDCALGKKYTALSLTREFKKRGVDADFRATGQTGILIAGRGIPIDSVVADFVAGAAEALSPDAAPNHWDVVEGQGSVQHPSYAAVSLGLLHGTQPDVIVMCHEVGRDRVLGLEDYATPSVSEAIELTLTLARRTNPKVRCVGVSLNTSQLSEEGARAVLADHSVKLGLPAADPLRSGPELDRLVDACLRGSSS